MAEQVGNGDKGGDTAVNKAVSEFVSSLSEEHRALYIQAGEPN
ncbi:MAG: hypothetical protein ACYSR4_02445 [Planctomycetota bacterium]|jgi:hypothetical protein